MSAQLCQWPCRYQIVVGAAEFWLSETFWSQTDMAGEDYYNHYFSLILPVIYWCRFGIGILFRKWLTNPVRKLSQSKLDKNSPEKVSQQELDKAAIRAEKKMSKFYMALVREI